MGKDCETCEYFYRAANQYPCVRCDRNYDGIPSEWELRFDFATCRIRLKPRKPKTNADRIRSMSDEELAWELMTWRIEAHAKAMGDESALPDTQQKILNWLQQPMEEK